MIEVSVSRVGNSINTKQAVVILSKKEGNDIFPIGIGLNEALAIFISLNNKQVPRPLTHDLLSNILNKYKIKFKKVEITEKDNNKIFYAEAVLEKKTHLTRMDCRSSDGIALALREKAPIYVSQEIADEHFVNMPPSEIIEPLEVKRM